MNPNESKNFYFACSDDFGLVSYMFQLLYFGFDAVGKEFLKLFPMFFFLLLYYQRTEPECINVPIARDDQHIRYKKGELTFHLL